MPSSLPDMYLRACYKISFRMLQGTCTTLYSPSINIKASSLQDYNTKAAIYHIPALRMPQRFATSVAPDVQITLFMWHLRMTESHSTLNARWKHKIFTEIQFTHLIKDQHHCLISRYLVHLYIAAGMICDWHDMNVTSTLSF